MIKENGNYIAVKVETRENYEIGYEAKSNMPFVYWNSGEVYLNQYFENELKIIGLLSKQSNQEAAWVHLWRWFKEIPREEWSQWLIIKKSE